MYFDVAEGETAVQLTEAMVAFLTRNEVALSKLVLGEEIIETNLDIGLIMDENRMSISITMNRRLIALADKLQMSISVGAMRSAPE